MVKCSVPLCKGNATFTFPKDEKRRILWENAKSTNFLSTKSSRLCANHFEEDEIIKNNESYYTGVLCSKKMYLKPTAVPSLRLKLGMTKPERLEKIRKTLFIEDFNSSTSSLSLSLLDESTGNAEDFCEHSEEMSTAAIIKPNSQTSKFDNFTFKENDDIADKTRNRPSANHSFNLSNVHNEKIDPHMTLQKEKEESNKSLLEENTAHDVEVMPFTVNNSDINYEDIQLEETVFSPSFINKKDEIMVQNKNEFPNEEKKTFKPTGVQTVRGYLSVAAIRHKDNVIHYFTGLETYEKFQFVYGTLSSYVPDIKYTHVQVKCMPPEDMFLVTLTKLRRNIPDFGLGFYFEISEALVSNIFNTWIRFINQLWSLLDIWPSREIVDFYMPKGFKKYYSSTRVLVDATEIPIAEPSNPVAQQSTFSTYKNKNTVKVLVGATPGGLLCYNSTAYGGSTSDRQIVERSNLLQKCEAGDSIMADRGFNVDDMCQPYGILVNIPHFLKVNNFQV